MYPDPVNRFSSRQRDTAVDAAFQCNTEFLAGFQKVVELNMQTIKTSLSPSSTRWQTQHFRPSQ
jgi:hypothetical protein